MSTLKVGTIQNTSAAHSSTPEEIAQGRAKAWVNFNGTGTVAIRDSFNVGSITDIGVGQYTINFATNMSNDDYCVVFQNTLLPHNNITHGVLYINGESSQTASGVRVHNCNVNGSAQTIDKNIVCATVFGD